VVPAGGYAWWYVDAVSDDGNRALAAIFFIGSVFSPSYAAACRRGPAPPAEDYLGVNLALYDRGRRVAWVMSEYPSPRLQATTEHLQIADSHISVGDGTLQISLDEKTAPWGLALVGVGRRIRGSIVVTPECDPISGVELGEGSGHRWEVPIPRGRIQVRLSGFDFDGTAYHDTNRGDGRLESTLSRWSWARFHGRSRLTVLYTTLDKAGQRTSVLVDAKDGDPALKRAPVIVPDGPVGPMTKPGWGLELPSGFSVDGGRVGCDVSQILDVAPFYARYLATLRGGGVGIGEHLDLDRFSRRGLQFLLRFMTRRAR